MAFNAYEIKRLEKIVGAHINKDLDQGFHISDQSVELFELKPDKQHPGEFVEMPTARATYIKPSQNWKVYWMHADRKWHGYEPVPRVETIEEFLRLVADNEYGCFYG
ncbi:MAG: DUF3024 domain-containing protein [bacterium]|jgi:hypothetical protein|nr:DUF3024 domain-containing protein [bacterium]